MKKLFSCADAYIKTMTITEMGQLKLCLASIGILIGLSVKKEQRKTVAVGAAALMAATYLPLMSRFVKDMSKMYKNN